MKQAYRYSGDLSPLSWLERKIKGRFSLTSLLSPAHFLFCGFFKSAAPAARIYTVLPLSPIWPLRMPRSSLLFFSPFFAWQEWLSYTEDRRGAEVLLSPCWAPVRALGKARCELHTRWQWQRWLLLWLCSTVCADGAWPIHSSCPSKAAPRAACSEPNPACQISLQVTRLPPKHT